MAVETRHLCLFPPQILSTRVPVNGMEANAGNGMYCGGGPMGYGPLSGTTATTDTLLIPPAYGTTVADSVPVKTPMKSDSGLTYSIPLSRKRSRDNNAGIPNHHLLAFPQNHQQNSNSNRGGSFTFLGQDISFQIQQQQFEIDRFISQHTAKAKVEMEERRKSCSRRIITAVEETVMKKLKAKDEEIDKIGRLNWALEEKVKSLCVENQIWRELAQTNEATADALRNNLEQVLLAQQLLHDNQNDAAALSDDAQSCCGSNLVAEVEDKDQDQQENDNAHGGGATSVPIPPHDFETNKRKGKTKDGSGGGRLCRNCGKDEASVLLLPCRHLCLCVVCGPSLHTCPVCLCTKNGTLRVNLSSSSY